jgi:hypothetical protein
MSRTLNESERILILNALQTAAETYANLAGEYVKNGDPQGEDRRLFAQFCDQEDKARKLYDEIEQADRIQIWAEPITPNRS